MTDKTIHNIPVHVQEFYDKFVKDKSAGDWYEKNETSDDKIKKYVYGDDLSDVESDDTQLEDFYEKYMSKGIEIWYSKMKEIFTNYDEYVAHDKLKNASQEPADIFDEGDSSEDDR